MRAQDLLAITDLDSPRLDLVLQTALAMKRDGSPRLLEGCTIALLFEKPSLRTRVSFEVGIRQLGGSCVYLSPAEIGLGVREPVRDVARVLDGYCDALVVRTEAQEVLAELARWCEIPVINALTSREHPCQALADMLTILEEKGRLRGVRVAYVGDSNNVARSLAGACALAGAELTLSSPAGYELPRGEIDALNVIAAHGGRVETAESAEEAVRGVDVIYTDVWASMGQEGETALRAEAFAGFSVNAGLVALAAPDAIVMHDLPAHRGEEISDDVIESPRSVVFRQAHNRLHAQKAALALILGNDNRQEV